MEKRTLYLLLIALILISCHKQDQIVPSTEEIRWDKLDGKIVAFDYLYAFVADGKAKKIDTILKQPTYLPFGEFHIFGSKGVAYSQMRNLILYTRITDNFNANLQSMQLDGSNQWPLHLQASWVNSPVENRNGSIAYFSAVKNSSEIKSLWVDQKKIFTFSIHNVSPMNYLDWHPSNKVLLVGLLDNTKTVPFSTLTEISVVDSTLHVVLEAKESTFYYSPHYSPDGKRIVFVLDDLSGSSICIVNRDGTGLMKLIDNYLTLESNPVWSPDGSKIAYNLREKGIYIVNADGADNTLLFKGNPNKWIGHGLIWLP